MRIARDHLHDPDLFAAYFIIDHRVVVAVLVLAHLAQLDKPVPVHYHEFLVLRMVPVLPLGDARFGDVHRELPPVGRAENLRETPTSVRVHLQIVSEPILREVRQIGRIELLGKAVRRRVGDLQRLGHPPKRVQQVDDPAQRNPVRCRNNAESPVAVFAPRERPDQFVHHVVDIDQMQFHRRVVHRDRKVVRDIVAERSDCRIVIRTAPFAEKIRKTVNQYFRAGLFGIVEQQLFAGTLGLAVGIVQRRLDR